LVAAFGSAPWARRNSIAATWPFIAAKWKAVLPSCKGARKGTRHGRCVSKRHARSTAQEGTTRSNPRGLGEGHAAAGSLPALLCPVLKQPGRELAVWACCRNSTPWCSNALKLCKQHRADALSRSLNSRQGRPGSLFKFHVIACVMASAGLVRAAHACLCTSHDRPTCSAAPLTPSLPFFSSQKASSGARTQSLAFGSAPWARRNSIAATWPLYAA